LVGPISFGFITRERSDCKDLLHIHVRCFPVFFLKSQTTEWPTLPERNRWVRLGQFIGFFSWTLYLGD
jgi:hypothetical protein